MLHQYFLCTRRGPPKEVLSVLHRRHRNQIIGPIIMGSYRPASAVPTFGLSGPLTLDRASANWQWSPSVTRIEFHRPQFRTLLRELFGNPESLVVDMLRPADASRVVVPELQALQSIVSCGCMDDV